jgi:Rod binding domain-containing protein
MHTVPLAAGPLSSSSTSDAAYVRKVVKAARDFEAVLLTSLFGSLEKTFTAIGAKSTDPGANDYQFMGAQALGSGLAASGGIGIAGMIVHNLLKSGGTGTERSVASPTKVSLRLDDKQDMSAIQGGEVGVRLKISNLPPIPELQEPFKTR